jgi:uncharacterized OB-fold protein
MNTRTLKFAAMALMPAAILAFTSCSTTPEGEGKADVIETKDGAMIVETFTTTATVTAINAAKRKLTLVSPDGAKTTYKAGPEVVNFSQIRIGDRVKATVTEEVAVFLRKDGVPPRAGVGAAIGLAVKGAKPGAMMADTQEVFVKIVAIDANHHKVTLQFADGKTKKLKVGKKVDLTNVKPGDNVVVQVSEALAILVEKP